MGHLVCLSFLAILLESHARVMLFISFIFILLGLYINHAMGIHIDPHMSKEHRNFMYCAQRIYLDLFLVVSDVIGKLSKNA